MTPYCPDIPLRHLIIASNSAYYTSLSQHSLKHDHVTHLSFLTVNTILHYPGISRHPLKYDHATYLPFLTVNTMPHCPDILLQLL